MTMGLAEIASKVRSAAADSADASDVASPRSVLVVGHDHRMNLAIMRSLGRAGIAVDLAWCRPDSSSTRCSYLREFIPTRWPELPGGEGVADLVEAIGDRRYDQIVPASDPSMASFAAHGDLMRHIGRVCIPNADAIVAALDKHEAAEIAEALGLPVPPSAVVRSCDELPAAIQRFRLPLVLKPRSSVETDETRKKRFVVVCESESHAQRVVEKSLETAGDVLVQPFLRGTGIGVEFLARDGQVLAVHQHQRLHEAVGFGSSYRESTPLHPELVEATRAFVEHVGYTGVGMCEFRMDHETGEWWFIELNGRFWGSLPLAIQAEADFPLWQFQMLENDRLEFPADYKVGVRSRDLYMDVRWMMHSLTQRFSKRARERAGGRGWEVNQVSLLRWGSDLARLVTGRDYSDAWSPDDRDPGRAELKMLMRWVLRKVSFRVFS